MRETASSESSLWVQPLQIAALTRPNLDQSAIQLRLLTLLNIGEFSRGRATRVS